MPATISGTAKADRLAGTAGDDVIVAGGGSDTIKGKGGDDLICGGRGRDLLLGGSGDDSLNGGPQKDSCEGGTGGNRLVDCELTDGIPASAAPTANRPPRAGEISVSTDERSPVSVDVVAAAGDPDGEALTVSAVDRSGTVGDATVDGPHSVRFDPAAGFRSLAPGQQAATSFGYTVADNRGGSAGSRVTVTVTGTDDPPLAIGDTAHLDEGVGATAIGVLANDTDVDGGPKTIVSTTSGAHGTVAISAGGGGLTYTPDGGYCNDGGAADTFTYTLNGGSTAQVAVAIACNPGPVAVDDAVTLTQGAAASAINVLANDTGAGGGGKSIASKTNGAHGLVTLTAGGGGLTYTPDGGYCNDGEAADTFTYTLDGGSSATVSVSVTCVTTVATSAALEPSFDPAVPDYTTRCAGTPLEVSGRTATGATVAIDGAAPDEGAFEATVPLQEGQEFGFATIEDGEQHDYHVRCLPSDFPIWEYTALKPAAREFYVVTPTLGAGFSPYVVIFDRHGVPLWWHSDTQGPNDAKFVAAGRIAWWGESEGGTAYEIRNLNGELFRTVRIPDGSTDLHELQQEPNGDYLLISYQPREHVDLTEFGWGPDETVEDGVVEEIDALGHQVWRWSTEGHIALSETGRWWPTLTGTPRDIVHMNAIEPVGDDAMLISLHSTDAVYKVDKTTGEVIWKLGGTWTPKSLTVLGDPQGAYPFGGQHDVRLLPDGTITVDDDNTNLPNPPRAVRYSINEANHTATLVEQITDPLVPSSFCCGSARRSADGSWLISWGSRSLVTEFNAAHERTFKLGFGGTVFSYRAVTAPDRTLSSAALRAGMDHMYPR